MDLFNLVAKLSLDSNEYDRALAAAKGTAVTSGNSIVKSVNKTKKAIGVAALGMTAAIGAFGVKSVKTGMEFDSAMSQVAATMGKTMDDLASETGKVDLAWGEFSGNLREYAQEMGAHTRFSATQAAEALNYMALAGYNTQKSMEMLPPVLNLAAAGSMDLAKASDMVTDASSALGLTQEETVEMVDKMAKTASKSNTSVEQLGDAMLTVGGTAKVLKGGTTELSTALGILADNGTKGAEGGTALRNVLTAIQGGKFEKTFGALGVEAYDAQGNLRSLKDIFLDMQDAMDGMTSEERTDIINKTFNARDLKNVNALLGTSADRWDELTAAIDDSNGAAEEMAATQLDNLAGDITLLKSAFEGLQIAVSDKLEPYIRKFVQFLTWCIDHASTLGPIILGLAAGFGTFAVAINIGSIIQGVTTAFAALNAILIANPIGLIVAAVVALGVALVALWKNNEDFRNKVIAIWNSIKAAATKVWNGIKSAIIDPIKSAYNTVKGWVDKIKNFFPLKVGKIFTGLKVPHIKIQGGKAPFGIGGKGEKPNIDVVWNRKAENTPYLFSGATLFGAGEHNDEVLYGRRALMNDISKAVSTVGGTFNYVFNIYGGDKSAKEIAEEVKAMIIQEEKRRKVAWA